MEQKLLFTIFINVVTKQPRKPKLYMCGILVNIRNINVRYSHCGPIHFD